MLTVLTGDALTMLRTLPDESVQTCVTSPPYWGLRDYGMPGQLGQEPTPEEFAASLTDVFREVKRVLREDGTLWLNLGDSYTSGGRKTQVAPTLRTAVKDSASGKHANLNGLCCRPGSPENCKPKDLIGIPWLVAFALRADGWYLRQDIIWSKPNPMPESVSDRCTKAHEYIFLLTKSERYHFDAAAIAEPLAYGSELRLSQPNLENQAGSDRVPGKTNGNMKAVYREPYTGKSTKEYAAGGAQDASATKARIVDRILAGEITTRNKRSVWTVTTCGYNDAHFATFPPDLIKPCILAGCPVGGLVLDPFGGSGTTGMVAIELGRRAILIELNPEYVVMIRDRCNVTPGLAL